MNKRQAEH
jgi:ATPase family AAA domain-containing protein 3A/B